MGEIVTIERMGFGPEAVAHLESGKAVFVEGGAPGDVLAIELTEEKHSFARARIVEVKEPAACRAPAQAPDCRSARHSCRRSGRTAAARCRR